MEKDRVIIICSALLALVSIVIALIASDVSKRRQVEIRKSIESCQTDADCIRAVTEVQRSLK